MAIQFKKATKFDAKLRLGLSGPSGSGKTRTALEIANALAPEGKLAVLDTERGSASKYSDLLGFDVVEPDSFHPQVAVDCIRAAEQAGYDVLIIDSLSHFWMGKDGELEQVDRIAKRNPSGNSFQAWREVTPLHNKLVDAIMGAKLHIIVTLRVKTEWVIEENERGKKVPRKVGLAPVMKDGVEYEMDVFGELNQSNDLVITKTRCDALNGETYHKAGENVASVLRAWLRGEARPEPKPMAAAIEPHAPRTVADPFDAARASFVKMGSDAAAEFDAILKKHGCKSLDDAKKLDGHKKEEILSQLREAKSALVAA